MRMPKEVVTDWIAAFNHADPDSLASLYADTAVNHQVMFDPVVGREAIRAMFRREFATAKMVCIAERLYQDGTWAILEWRDPKGLRGCGFFQVIGGLIHHQRGYWDQLSFLRQQGLPMPVEEASSSMTQKTVRHVSSGQVHLSGRRVTLTPSKAPGRRPTAR